MTTAWVADASVTLRWVFRDQATPETEALLDRVSTDDVHAPALWRVEVANAVVRRFREGAFNDTEALSALNDLFSLPIIVHGGPGWSETLQVAGWAMRLGLKAHDASYLELSHRLRLPLATLDRRLAGAVETIGVAVLPATAA